MNECPPSERSWNCWDLERKAIGYNKEKKRNLRQWWTMLTSKLMNVSVL